MKFFKIFAVLAVHFLTAQQGTRFIYQANLTPDSTNIEKKTELSYLDTDGKKSFFYAEKTLKRDSLMQRVMATKTFDRSQMQDLRSNLQFTIVKNLIDQSLAYKSRIGRDQYSYNEKIDFHWKILPETAKIGDYETQKAETNFGGRIWYAWFAQDIPFQDGPYKFSGLPGLIIKVQDSKGDYSFDLLQTKKITQIKEPESRGQYINISKSKFVDMEKKIKKDPVSFMNSSQSSRGIRSPQGAGSPPPPPNADPKRKQENEKRMIEEYRSQNNPIELK